MENFFDLLANEAENEINDAQIRELLQLSCEDSHLMDFMFEGNPIDAQMVEEPIYAQMIGGSDALYTLKKEVTKEFKCMEKTIQLKASIK